MAGDSLHGLGWSLAARGLVNLRQGRAVNELLKLPDLCRSFESAIEEYQRLASQVTAAVEQRLRDSAQIGMPPYSPLGCMLIEALAAQFQEKVWEIDNAGLFGLQRQEFELRNISYLQTHWKEISSIVAQDWDVHIDAYKDSVRSRLLERAHEGPTVLEPYYQSHVDPSVRVSELYEGSAVESYILGQSNYTEGARAIPFMIERFCSGELASSGNQEAQLDFLRYLEFMAGFSTTTPLLELEADEEGNAYAFFTGSSSPLLIDQALTGMYLHLLLDGVGLERGTVVHSENGSLLQKIRAKISSLLKRDDIRQRGAQAIDDAYDAITVKAGEKRKLDAEARDATAEARIKELEAELRSRPSLARASEISEMADAIKKVYEAEEARIRALSAREDLLNKATGTIKEQLEREDIGAFGMTADKMMSVIKSGDHVYRTESGHVTKYKQLEGSS